MKQGSKANLIISSIAMVGAFIAVLYLIFVMPSRLDLIITFSCIILADTYFFVDGIIKKIDAIADHSIDKQNELAKVEKGIYSVAKREESAASERIESLISTVESLKEDNQRLHDALIEQQKLYTKIIMKKNQENTEKTVESTDRIAKVLIQLTNNNNTVSAESLQLLQEITDALNDSNEKENLLDHPNVRIMTPRAE